MKSEKYPISKQSHITVTECHGDLVIRGRDEREVLVKGDDFQVSESKAGLSIASSSRLRLTVPADATLTVSQAQGDLVIKNIDGLVEMDEVQGDSILVELGAIRADTIQGDLSAKRINGPLSVSTVHGDMIARNVQELAVSLVHGDLSARYVDGSVRLGAVNGDLNLRHVSGDASADRVDRDANLGDLGGQTQFEDVRGDVRLSGTLCEDKHSFSAAGDIVLRWPEDHPITITATAPQIVNRLQFDEIVEADGSFNGQMDGSNTFLTLTAKGSIVLKAARVVEEKWEWDQAGDLDFDFSLDIAGLGERISAQVNEHVARITADLEGRFGPEFSQKMADKIAKRAERAAAKAERAAERAMRRAERDLKRAGRRTGRQRPAPPPPPRPKKKASSEEQLKILKMVERGIISTDEASTLLEALES